jgi:hypothetical protein
MASRTLRKDESAALLVALAAHAGLVAWLALRPPEPPLPLPERMTVTISDEIALTETSPEPAAQAAPETAPTIGEAEPAPVPSPSLAPLPKPPEKLASLAPRPVPSKVPPKQALKPPAKVPPKPPGKSQLGKDFLNGIPDTPTKGTARTPPATAIGPAVKEALERAIWREIRPHWQGKVPQGLNSELLVSMVRFELRPDGSLAAIPVLVRQDGIDETNRQQARRHAEEAIKAVQLAAPFDLPPEMYAGWKNPPPFKFRKSATQ